MRLSSEIIAYEIKKLYSESYSLCNNSQMNLSLPQIYDTQEKLESKTLYIAEVELLPADISIGEGSMIICYNGKPPEAFHEQNCSLLWFGKQHSLAEVLNALTGIYKKYQDWEDELYVMVHHGESPQAIIDFSIPIMENLTNVQDATFTTIATTAELQRPKVIEKGSFEEAIFTFRVTPDFVNSIKDIFIKTRDQRAVLLSYCEATGNCLCINLFDGHVYIGNLSMLEYPRPFLPHDKDLLAYLATIVQEAMLRSEDRESNHAGRFSRILQEMLSGKHVDDAVLKMLIENSGFQAQDDWQCAAVYLSDEMTKEMILYTAQSLAKKIPGTSAFTTEKKLAVIFNINYAKSKGCNIEEDFKNILESLALQAGVSDPFNNLLNVRRFYAEAIAVLSLGLEARDSKTIFTFEQYRKMFILKNCKGKLTAEMLFPQGFCRLLEHDRTSSVSYVNTLRVYLDENMNASQAAKKLFIQRNSFLARLERLESILSLDLEDPDVRFLLNLCIRLMDA